MQKLSLVSLQNIKIDDSFWNKYTHLVKDVIIPHQWDILNDNLEDVETSHCIANFKIAAGLEAGSFRGVVFQDTDVAKWLEAVAYSLAVHPDPLLEKTADGVIELIKKAQQPDGYINTYYTIKEPHRRFTNLREGHELYTAGHLMEAAVAYYRATGKDRFLNFMCDFADLICEQFSEKANAAGCPGHQEVEIGLFKLYEVTGKQQYLAQAKSFLDRRGRKPNYFLEEAKRPDFKGFFPEFENYDPKYSQSHLPVREQVTAEGHAVRAVYMCCAMADVAAAYGDEELLNACKLLWENIVTKRMYITGSIGSSGLLERFTTDYDLPNNSNYSETCASIGLALFSRRMAQITGAAGYMDIVETALYNTVLAGIAMDGKSFFYVNPLEVWPDNCIPRTSKEHVKPVRQKWFGVACCPPNIARTLASLGEYIYFAGERTLWINLFISNDAKVTIDGQEFLVSMESNFPNDGNIKITVGTAAKKTARLAIRIPGYVKEWRISIDGAHIKNPKTDNGYVILEQEFERNAINVEFALPPRIVRANPLVREDIGKAAVMKGPIVYCLEETDNGSNLPAIYLLAEEELKEHYEEELLGGATVIKAAGKRVIQQAWETKELYGGQRPVLEKQELTFIPYPYWGNRKTGEMLVWVKELFN
ncbi:MAG: glycoside hydrolase family 127 protein [Lachnospiraceae bacterium]